MFDLFLHELKYVTNQCTVKKTKVKAAIKSQ